MTRSVFALILLATLSTGSAWASESPAKVTDTATVAAAATEAPIAPLPIKVDLVSRPSMLKPMYASLTALQGYDIYTTRRVLNQGGVEANPLMSGVVKNQMAFVAVKGAVTATSIVAAEKLWRQGHRGAAIALMAISNGMMAYVAAHNTASMRAATR